MAAMSESVRASHAEHTLISSHCECGTFPAREREKDTHTHTHTHESASERQRAREEETEEKENPLTVVHA